MPTFPPEVPRRTQRELTFVRDMKRGHQGPRIEVVQEWLSLHGPAILIDGDFGPATQRAVKRFQESNAIAVDGVVGEGTFDRLVAPMVRAIAPIDPTGTAYGDLVIAYAQQHLAEHPREVGGPNRGPWVRLYMSGMDGKRFLWCAGFSCFMLQQAASKASVDMPLERTVSCDRLARNAQEAGNFLGEDDLDEDRSKRGDIAPGSLFLKRKTPGDWVHTGLVVSASEDSFETIEGNTNDEGSREGYEVCARIRGYRKMDFVTL